jgi:hypothetical protein
MFVPVACDVACSKGRPRFGQLVVHTVICVHCVLNSRVKCAVTTQLDVQRFVFDTAILAKIRLCVQCYTTAALAKQGKQCL